MRIAFVALLLAALAAPRAGFAQAPLVIGSGSAATSTAAALHRGYAAFPATALRALGMDVTSAPEGARVIAWRDTIVLHTLSPFFTTGDELHQLAHPAYAEGGVVYLPRQFFSEWLPARYPDSLAVVQGALVSRSAARPTPAPRDSAARPVQRDSVAAQPLGTPAPPPRPVPTARELARVVVIDAGHGGRDAGAQGPGGVREKDVTLGIALRLAALMRSRPGYEVHLTRATDTLVSLFDRPRLANEWRDGRAAALFVSIHANSHRDASAAGFETFILSEARTADERAVAERENAASSYDDREGPQDELSFILSDLRNEFYVHASHDLATLVQNQIDPFHPGSNRGVKQAAFVVLVGAYMPAVLVETAFVSNPAEARLLASSSFQDQMAMALSRAVHDYFETHAYLSDEDSQ